MNTPDDQDLLRKAQKFDLPGLAAIYDRYSSGLYVYAMRSLGDENLAKDCVAETFSRFLNALRDGRGPQSYLQAYLYRIAHNWITDLYRRQPPPPQELTEDLHAGSSSHPESLLDQQMEREQIRRALFKLTADQRQVITLKFIENWNYDEIAAALQKPIGTVRVLQHRALAALRDLLLQKEKEGVYGHQ